MEHKKQVLRLIVAKVEAAEPDHLCGPDCPCWDLELVAESREMLANAGALG